MGASKGESEPNKGCGGCLLAMLGLALIITVPYYFFDVHNVQTLHAGDESRYDPIAAFPHAQGLAAQGQDLEFLQMTARFVKSDGTMDLTADYGPTTTYQWAGGAIGGDAPLGAGGGGARRLLVTVRATDFGFELAATLPAGERYYDLNLGLRRVESWLASEAPTTSRPACKLAGLWKHAIGAGADPTAVAVIHYDSTGYDFRIDGTPFNMRFGADCNPKK